MDNQYKLSPTDISNFYQNYINYKKRIFRDKLKWDVSNTTIIINWINTANLNILILNVYLLSLKKKLKMYNQLMLIISSITSIGGLSNATVSDISSSFWGPIIIYGIVVASLFTTILSGFIKLKNYQEDIEKLEQLKNEWSSLIYVLISELQKPIYNRQSADIIISENIQKFNELNLRNIHIPSYIRKNVSRFLISKQIDEMEQKNRGFWSLTCSYIFMCFQRNNFRSYNIKSTKRKISLYYYHTKALKKELLQLIMIYSDTVKHIKFIQRSDLFNFRIIYFNDFNYYIKNDIQKKPSYKDTIIPIDSKYIHEENISNHNYGFCKCFSTKYIKDISIKKYKYTINKKYVPEIRINYITLNNILHSAHIKNNDNIHQIVEKINILLSAIDFTDNTLDNEHTSIGDNSNDEYIKYKSTYDNARFSHKNTQQYYKQIISSPQSSQRSFNNQNTTNENNTKYASSMIPTPSHSLVQDDSNEDNSNEDDSNEDDSSEDEIIASLRQSLNSSGETKDLENGENDDTEEINIDNIRIDTNNNIINKTKSDIIKYPKVATIIDLIENNIQENQLQPIQEIRSITGEQELMIKEDLNVNNKEIL